MSRRMLVLTFVGCTFWSAVYAQETPPSFVQLVQQMRDQLSNANTNERPQIISMLISTFETETSARPNDPGLYLAYIALADLYTIDKQPNSAAEVLDQVLRDASDAGTLLSASLRAAKVSILSGQSINNALSYIDLFETMIIEFRTSDTLFSQIFDTKYFEIDLMRSKLFADRVNYLQVESAEVSNVVFAPMIGLLLSDGSSYLESYISTLQETGETSNLHRFLLRQAQMCADAAMMYDSVNSPIANSLRYQAISLVEQIITEFNTSISAQNGVKLLLREKYFIVDSLEEYVEYVNSLSDRLMPGHAILNFLTAEAHNLSRDPRTFVAANSLFDVVLELEQRWFEEEYKHHANYKWALLGGARNSLKMGDYEEVTWRLQLLEKLDLKGAVFKKWFSETQATFSKYIANKLTVRIPDGDKLELIVVELIDTADKTVDALIRPTPEPIESELVAISNTENESALTPIVALSNKKQLNRFFGIPDKWLLTFAPVVLLVLGGVYLIRRNSIARGT